MYFKRQHHKINMKIMTQVILFYIPEHTKKNTLKNSDRIIKQVMKGMHSIAVLGHLTE